jgi:hypothetical protein
VELYFAQDMEILGKVSTHQLKDDGEDELVTTENKEEYIRSAISISTLSLLSVSVSHCAIRHWCATY